MGGPVGKAAGRKSLLFTGHIDVVPTVGQGQYGWWDGTVADGKLYGRGANDMKGGIAAYLMAARCIRDLGLELKGDLILETVVDEEFGGAHGSLACRLRGYNADLAILPEPNNMLVSTAHRGGQQFRLFAYTEGAGMDFGATVFRDPVTALGHLLAALDRYNEERQPRLRGKGFENDVFPLMPFVLRAGELLPWGTGEAIPETAWVEFWIEIPPGVTEEQLKSELRAVVDRTTEVHAGVAAGLRPLGGTHPLPGRQRHARRPSRPGGADGQSRRGDRPAARLWPGPVRLRWVHLQPAQPHARGGARPAWRQRARAGRVGGRGRSGRPDEDLRADDRRLVDLRYQATESLRGAAAPSNPPRMAEIASSGRRPPRDDTHSIDRIPHTRTSRVASDSSALTNTAFTSRDCSSDRKTLGGAARMLRTRSAA